MDFQDGSREMVEQLIRRMGFLFSYHGTWNLVDAVLLCIREPDALTAITKRIYPTIAKKEGSNWRRVERNMRTAVDAFWERGNRELLSSMAGYSLMVRPSVGEIINYITGYIRELEFQKQYQ